MGTHPGKHVRKKTHCVDNMRTLVQHDPFGAYAHRRVRHFGTGGDALLRQGLEHLRAPDHRQMCGLAQPQDLLLDLGESGEADLDREVATRHHHPQRCCRETGQQDRRQCRESLRRLDLEDDPRAARPASEQRGQFRHVAWLAYE